MVGPIGYTGSTGIQGGTGYTGSASTVAGPIGYTGSQGTAGSTGYVGSRGYDGSQGAAGSTGYTGSASTVAGSTGYTGSASTVVGYTGSQGAAGTNGATGPGGPVVLIASTNGDAFTFTDGVASPSSQTLNFVANRQNTSGSITWSSSPSVTLTVTGTGNVNAALTLANFGANSQVAITATDSTTGASDTITVVKLTASTAAAGATQGSNVVLKPSFKDGLKGGWSGGASGTSAISANSPGGLDGTGEMDVTDRDVYEANNTFTVVPGQTWYVDAWVWTGNSVSSSTIAIGLHCTDASNGTSNWVVGAAIAGGQGWTHITGKVLIPTGNVLATPWLNQNVTAGTTSGLPYVAWNHIYISQVAPGADVTALNTAAAIAGQGALATSTLTATQVTNALVATGANYIVNSELSQTSGSLPIGFANAWGGNSAAYTGNIDSVISTVGGAKAIQRIITFSSSPSGAVFDCLNVNGSTTYAIPVTPGQTLMASCAVAAQNTAGTAYLCIAWFDSNGSYVQENDGGTVSCNINGATTDIASWPRAQWSAIVPADGTFGSPVRYAVINTRFNAGTATTQTAWSARPMLSVVPTGQTVYPSYQIGPVSRLADQTSTNTALNTSNVGAITAGSVASTINSGGGVAANQVPTSAIVANAVTGSVGASGTATISGSGTYQVSSATLTTTGGPVYVSCTASMGYYLGNSLCTLTLQIVVDGTVTYSVAMPNTCPAGYSYAQIFLGSFAAGSHTVKIQAVTVQSGSGPVSGSITGNLYMLETKR